MEPQWFLSKIYMEFPGILWNNRSIPKTAAEGATRITKGEDLSSVKTSILFYNNINKFFVSQLVTDVVCK